jgi:hypothetical protein
MGHTKKATLLIEPIWIKDFYKFERISCSFLIKIAKVLPLKKRNFYLLEVFIDERLHLREASQGGVVAHRAESLLPGLDHRDHQHLEKVIKIVRF